MNKILGIPTVYKRFITVVLLFTYGISALGMDIPGVVYVIHYGLPSSLDEYVQETGRAGRDGEQSYAISIIHRHALKGSTMSAEVKEYARSITCRRVQVLQAFGESVEPTVSPTCCDICDTDTLHSSEFEQRIAANIQ